MKANFGKDAKTNKTQLIEGDYERMLKERKDKMPELETAVNEVLDGWNGESLCIIKIHEDENGDPRGRQLFIGGVTKLGNQLALGKALSEAAEDVREKLLDTAKDDPRAAKQILDQVLNLLVEEIKGDK